MPYKDIADQRLWWEERRRVNREIIEEAKKAPCTDCGGSFHFCAMQFDHVRGEKKFNIGAANGRAPSIKALLEEIEKCELVCANCHSIRTYERGYRNENMDRREKSC